VPHRFHSPFFPPGLRSPNLHGLNVFRIRSAHRVAGFRSARLPPHAPARCIAAGQDSLCFRCLFANEARPPEGPVRLTRRRLGMRMVGLGLGIRSKRVLFMFQRQGMYMRCVASHCR
jgi:hypothetical protein